MPIDINSLRKEKGGDPDKIRKSQKDRFKDETLVDQVIELDEQWRKANYQWETLRMEFGKINKEIADKKKASKGQDKCEDLVEKSKVAKTKIEDQKILVDEIDKQRTAKLNVIGNVISDNVPIFKDEDNNAVVKEWGKVPEIKVDFKTPGKLAHDQIMTILDMVEFERGSKVAGHKGYYLKGNGLLLNQALINFGQSLLYKNEYTLLQPPFFMKASIMHETCQLSDFEENLYKVEGSDPNDPLYMIATSEQPISAMHKGEWIEPKELPLRYGGNSSCFRKEAGSHGRDITGIFRVHQFEKVEQFILCAPDKSWEEFEQMVATAEKYYQALELPYQLIKIVSGALNDAAAMKLDLEAWFPSYERYRELVSCSNCTDYQSRALEIRYALKNLEKGQQTPFVHLLNGTLCATERTMCCVVENYQTPEGVRIPKCLQPFMGGVEFIPYDKKKLEEFNKKLAADAKALDDKSKAKAGKPADDKKPKAKVDAKKPAPAKKVESKKAPSAPKGPTIVLHTPSKVGNMYADFIMITAAKCGVNVVEEVDPSLNSLCLKFEDGTTLTDSHAIASFIVSISNDQSLLGTTDMEKSQVDQWMQFLREETTPIVKSLQWYVFGHVPCASLEEFNFVQNEYKVNAKIINNVLKNKKFFLGDKMTICDIYFVLTHIEMQQCIMDPNLKNSLENINKIFKQITTEDAEFIKRMGNVRVFKKQIQPVFKA